MAATDFAVSIVYTKTGSSNLVDNDIWNFLCTVAGDDTDPEQALEDAITAFEAQVTGAYTIRNTALLDVATVPDDTTTQGKDTGTGPYP